MPPVIRRATPDDIPAMHAIRVSVRENRLTSTTLTDDDYRAAIAHPGWGWVAVLDGAVVGFAVANGATGNLWALFVSPGHERQGIGRQLHTVAAGFLQAHDGARPWLTTEAATRAERFYQAAGWSRVGTERTGEVRYELPPLPVIAGISPSFIVRDVPATLAFYRERLGFAVTFEGPTPDDIFFGIVRRAGAQILVKAIGLEAVPNRTRDIKQGIVRWDAFVTVPDPDALAAEYAGRGVRFHEPLRDTDDGLRGFEVEDLDGYLLFFGRPMA